MGLEWSPAKCQQLNVVELSSNHLTGCTKCLWRQYVMFMFIYFLIHHDQAWHTPNKYLDYLGLRLTVQWTHGWGNIPMCTCTQSDNTCCASRESVGNYFLFNVFPSWSRRRGCFVMKCQSIYHFTSGSKSIKVMRCHEIEITWGFLSDAGCVSNSPVGPGRSFHRLTRRATWTDQPGRERPMGDDGPWPMGWFSSGSNTGSFKRNTTEMTVTHMWMFVFVLVCVCDKSEVSHPAISSRKHWQPLCNSIAFGTLWNIAHGALQR